MINILYAESGHTKHPKCRGYKTDNPTSGVEYDCGYNSLVMCEDCKYCTSTPGRKDPEAKRNRLKV